MAIPESSAHALFSKYSPKQMDAYYSSRNNQPKPLGHHVVLFFIMKVSMLQVETTTIAIITSGVILGKAIIIAIIL